MTDGPISDTVREEFNYAGSELELFAAVHNWKSYWSDSIRPFIRGDVLEVGSGIGSNTPFLDRTSGGRWVCMEPDRQLLKRLNASLTTRQRPQPYETVCGTLATLEAVHKFDTIIYIDVLEHIEDDRAELDRAAAHLRSGGNLIVLAPAHQWLFTPFDKAIGHFRRYNRPMLQAITPPDLRVTLLRYFDSAGLAASIANRFLLRQSMPTKAQLAFWDSFVIPISRVTDKIVFHSIGKSLVAVWRKV